MVSHRQILRITEGANGATVLHLQEDDTAVMTAAWVEKNRPEVGGFLIDNGRGEVWFARNSLRTLPAVLVEVQRITPRPGELVVFRMPAEATLADREALGSFLRETIPGVSFVVMPASVESTIVAGQQSEGSGQGAACARSAGRAARMPAPCR